MPNSHRLSTDEQPNNHDNRGNIRKPKPPAPDMAGGAFDKHHRIGTGDRAERGGLAVVQLIRQLNTTNTMAMIAAKKHSPARAVPARTTRTLAS